MNSKTRDEMLKFITAMELLAQVTIHMIGFDNCTEIMTAAEDLKSALIGDETIL